MNFTKGIKEIGPTKYILPISFLLLIDEPSSQTKVCGTGTDGRIGQPAVRFNTSTFRSEPRRTDERKWSRTGEEKEKKREI